MQVYLASPLGFSPQNADYRLRIKKHLNDLGHVVVDPWEKDWSHLFDAGLDPCDIAATIGEYNEHSIRYSDAILAVLDGMEPDSGTCSELGFAYGIGKLCFGLRTDIRPAGDFDGLAINLQLLRWINNSGGRLFRGLGFRGLGFTL